MAKRRVCVETQAHVDGEMYTTSETAIGRESVNTSKRVIYTVCGLGNNAVCADMQACPISYLPLLT